MDLIPGKIINLKHIGNDGRIYNHPHLVINVVNEEAVVLQITAIKYDEETQNPYFTNKQIEEEDYQGFTIDLTTEEGMKYNSIVLLRYTTIVTRQDRYRIVGELTNFEKLILINQRYQEEVEP
ncbi:hypothetical protein [Mesoplasma whartonense]|uniref:hypothetical protein n=1 Tax=Mesoplasma whartonense TaxID=2878854 RepID=UPI002022A067|nr:MULTISPECIES: hypothetical protein [unclassified Mesoplasma]MCL8212675.1 hypothetical protein [Mesoplasma sp. JKS002661]MCL8216416.1 hypothetical protein [Mesoplasma sp. JKS002657]